MHTLTLPATDAARNFSDVLNRVRYQSARFDITRGREVVARIVPPLQAPGGMPVAALGELLRRLAPMLSADERKRFASDVARARKQLKKPVNKWG